jgi:hypothetical protein
MILEKLKQIIKATGIYIYSFEKKRKDVTLDDDENGHLTDIEALRIINYCDDHSFLKDKYLDQETGITYDLFKMKEEQENELKEEIIKEGENEEGLEISQKEEKRILPITIQIDEVLRQERVKFYREPRLGCYLAIDLSYPTSLSKASLESAIENLSEYKQKLIELEEKKKELEEKRRQKEAEKEAEKKEKEQMGEDVEKDEGEKIEENKEEELEEELPVVELAHFQTSERKLILSLDNMGQDRVFTKEEIEFIYDVHKAIRERWKKIEEEILIKDRDLKLKRIKLEKEFREKFNSETFSNLEEKYIKEYIIENHGVDK